MQNKYVCRFTAHIRHPHIIVIQIYNKIDTKDQGYLMHYFRINYKCDLKFIYFKLFMPFSTVYFNW